MERKYRALLDNARDKEQFDENMKEFDLEIAKVKNKNNCFVGGKPILFYCCFKGIRDAIDILLKHGFDINKIFRNQTASYICYKSGHIELGNHISSLMNQKEIYFPLSSKIVKIDDLIDNMENIKTTGIFSYTIVSDVIYLCLCKTYRYDQITWFDGAVDKRKDKTLKDAAIREFTEETNNVFNITNINPDSYCIFNFREIHIILKLSIKYDLEEIDRMFISNERNSEIKELIWMTLDELFENIEKNPEIFYSIFRDTVKQIGYSNLKYFLETIN